MFKDLLRRYFKSLSGKMNDIVNTIKSFSDKLKPMFMEENPDNEATGLEAQIPVISSENHNAENQAKVVKSVKPTALEIFGAVLNGLGVGLLLGLLLGLAVSPVVSGIIGTLSSLLVVLLGLNDKYLGVVKGLRIGSFGLFAAAGILLGMFIRTNDILAPRTTELMEEYTKAGFEKNEGLYYVAREKFGFVPLGWFGTSAADTSFNTGIASKQSVLFSTEVDIGRCTVLKSVDKTFPKSEVIRAFKRAGGVWEELAVNLEQVLPDQVFVDAMVYLRDSFCGLGTSGKLEIKSSDQLLKFTSESNLEDIKKAINKSGENWQIILKNTQSTIPPENQKIFYLTLIKTFTDEKSN